MLRDGIEHICLSEHLTRDLVAIQTPITNGETHREIVIASAYFAGDGSHIPPKEVQKLVEYCRKRKLPLLIGCDANAHNEIWGSTDTNKRGEHLLEFLVEENLEIFNVGNTPTFVTRVREEVLDITFGTTGCRELVRDWRVSEEPSMSDHRIILYDLEGVRGNTPPRRNPRRTDWVPYITDLGYKLERCQVDRVPRHPLELENLTEEVTAAIKEAYEGNCPVGSTRGQGDAPWWSNRLSRLRAEARRLFNRAKRTGDWQTYTEALTEYNKGIREAKRRNFRAFCESISEAPETARLYKAMAKDTAVTLRTLKKPDGGFTENEEQTALLLLETHFPGSRVDCAMGHAGELGRPQARHWEKAAEIFTEQRIEWAMDTFQPYKSPGVDGIIPALLQRGKRDIIVHLIRMFRGSFALGYIPKLWRRARVIFIPKVGRRDTTLPKSFRPISLTSFLLKTMEKVVDNYLRTTALLVVPLHHSQHAYRAGRSTETALYQLTTTIRGALDCKETVICAFLDIEGAFDNTSHDAVRRALESRGVDYAMVDWIVAMLDTREVETQVGHGTITVNTTRGCPQGGVLSPLIWSLVVDELLAKLSEMGISCQAYADDIVIFARGKFEEALYDLVRGGLQLVYKWCQSVGLGMNPSKTTIVPFTRKRKLNSKEIRVGGVVVRQDKEVKYLGVILDSKLLWGRHVEEVAAKATRSLMICRRIAGKSWGCRPKTLRWMYVSIVRPMITYAAVVWGGRTEVGTARKALERVQRLACICISGAMRTCPTGALEVLLELTPLHFIVERVAKEGLIRIGSGENGKEHRVYPKDKDALLRGCALLGAPRDVMVKRYDFERKFSSEIGYRDAWSGGSTGYKIGENAIRWYTDGSRTTEGAGAGVFGPGTKYSGSLGVHATVFQAEVYAIGECTRFNLEKGYRGQEIAILSDSQAAIRALSSNVISSRLVWDCRDQLNELGTGNRVTLYWVPGHIGVDGNERADELARKGAENRFTGPEPFFGLPASAIKAGFRREEEKSRSGYWKGLPGLRQAKILLGDYDLRRYHDCMAIGRNGLRVLIGILSGHCRLRRHLSKLGLADTGICRFCGEEEETSIHVLADCGALIHKRMRRLGRHILDLHSIPSLSPSDILRFLRDTGLLEDL
jgi:ribonuclease HI